MSTEATLLDTKLLIPRHDPTSPDPTKPRFGEPAKFLPVCFVLGVIVALWYIYTVVHCLPLMRHEETYGVGWTHLVVFNTLAAMLVCCYFRSMMQHPGTIPDGNIEQGDVNWEYAPADGRKTSKDRSELEQSLKEQKERKRLGDRRNCKWCNKYKPDRCHHCRVCRMCILKMDHHCPWIYNCVGFKNFKYFFLLVAYSAVTSLFMVVTMASTVERIAGNGRSTFFWMFQALFGISLAALMALLLTAFLLFHIQLMIRAMTTIEFCEKSRRPNFDTECYSRGPLGNVKAVLGDNILLWLLPICPPSGDGMNFRSASGSPRLTLSRDFGYGTTAASTPSSAGRPKPQASTGGTGEAPVTDDATPIASPKFVGA